jgi:FkbM family methyltransferase
MIDFNRLKKQPVYFYSKFAKFGKRLKIKVAEDVHMLFRARTLDRAVLKDVWTKGVYSREGFEIEENDTVVDIGGHIGCFSVFAATKARNGKVYAFEPFFENFEMLLANRELNKRNNIVAENVAIGKEDGTFTFYIRPDELAKGEIAYNSGGHSFHLIKESGISVEIPTISFDSMIRQCGISKIDFLKMDCEGAEFDIIYNASKDSLSKVSKIAMECHPHDGHTKEAMVDFLERNGFTCLSNKDSKYDLYLVYAIRDE